MKALVTGGAGFIGSNLVNALVERGDDVRVLDNFSTGNRANLEGLDVEVVEGELRSYERVHAAVRGVEVVYHLGALGSVPRSVQDPLTSSAVNIEGTLNVLLAARDEGVRRVIFSSSTSVYGSSRELPTSESTPPDPISPYGVAKLAAERYCISFGRVYDSFETVVLRYFNVFGPRQSPYSQYAAVMPLFIAAIDQGEPVTIYGDGEQSRDFTYVGNVVDATIRAADAPERQRTHVQRRRGLTRQREPRRGDDRRRFSASRSRSATSRRVRETSEIRGRTSPRRASCSATSRASTSPQGSSSRPRRSLPESEKRIKILRVIARLNMGGPALHVAYLTEGLRKRGYDTTLVAGSLARGEDSMAFVADARGVEVVRIDELGREISPLRDLMATIRLARLIRKERPQILHTHTAKAGTVGRVAARLAGSRRPPIVVHTFHGHVLRGYFGPVRTLFFRLLERWLAAGTTALIAVSPQVRDDLVALGVAPRERFVVIRLGIELDERVAPERTAAPRAAAISAFPATALPSAGSAA